jgi:hypothetical protein
MRLKGHKLLRVCSYDSVSHLSHADCECGWSGNFRSAVRAREAHLQHKEQVREREAAKEPRA